MKLPKSSKGTLLIMHLLMIAFLCHFKIARCLTLKKEGSGDSVKTNFHRDYTGVYFDPAAFVEYNAAQHSLNETGIAVLVDKIRSQFNHIMVLFHVPQTDDGDSNDLVPATVARQNLLLNESFPRDHSTFMKVTILLKVSNWKDVKNIQSRLHEISNLINITNSIFPGTVKAVILKMANASEEVLQNYGMFREFFKNNASPNFGSSKFGIQVNIKRSTTKVSQSLRNILKDNFTEIIYLSENFNEHVTGISVGKKVEVTTQNFLGYRKVISGLNKNIEVGFMTTWPDTILEGQAQYSDLVDFWTRMDSWAGESKTSLILLQAFDTPMATEPMMTNGWWKFVPNSSYLSPAQFIFEEKSSLVDAKPESESVNLSWLRQETDFSRDHVGVVLSPNVLKPGIGKPNPYSKASLTALVLQIGKKFSKVFISTEREPHDEEHSILAMPQFVARLNKIEREKFKRPMEVVLTFDRMTMEGVAKLAQDANEIFPGTVKHLIYSPSSFDDEYGLLDSFTETMKNANFSVGIQIRLEACHNRVHFRKVRNILNYYYNHLGAKVIYIVGKVPVETSKLGVGRSFPFLTTMFEICKKEIDEYFGGRGKVVEVAYFTEWPLRGGEDNLEGILQFVKYWEGINSWAVKSNATVIFSSGFDAPKLRGKMRSKHGWWRLKENDTFPESVEDYLFEDKKEAALRNALKKLAEEEDSPYITSFGISAILFTILIVVALMPAVYYRLKTRKLNYLTKEDIDDFFNGGDNGLLAGNEENINKPYNKTPFEVSRRSFTIEDGKVLGSGAFGKVCRGTVVTQAGIRREVAVKMTNQACPRAALRGLLFEIKILSVLGKHPHIVELVGAYTSELKNSKVYAFLELCELGSLLGYLRKCRPLAKSSSVGKKFGLERGDSHLSDIGGGELDGELLKDMSRWPGEIASGMEFIASKHIVHMDIATRNIILTTEKRAKITDFGLSRRMYDYQSYIKKEHEPLPWRSMAPESLRRFEFTEKSDVWGFGVLLWEIYSLGDEPYPGLSWDVNFPTMLERGLRLGEPTYGQNSIYSVMLRCWTINPERRPTFSDLVRSLEYSYKDEVVQESAILMEASNMQNSDAGSPSAASNEDVQTDLNMMDIKTTHANGMSNRLCGMVERTCFHVGYVWSSLSAVLLLMLLFILVMSFGYPKTARKEGMEPQA